MLLSLARATRALSLGIWLGGIVMAFIVAPIVFKTLDPDRAKSGAIVGAILHTAGQMRLILALVALAAEAVIFFGKLPGAPQGSVRYVTAGALLAALGLTLFTFLWLEPAIYQIRDQITDFSAAAKNSPERVAFRKLHGVSMAVLLAEAVCVAIALFAAAL